MTQHAFTVEEFKEELRSMHREIDRILVQCGMELLVTTDAVEKKKVFRIVRDEHHSMRKFIDLVQRNCMDFRVEITSYDSENEEHEPQIIYNALNICHETAKGLLNAFFSMAQGTMAQDKKSWEQARALMPDALEALEQMFNRPSMTDKIREALERIKLGGLSSIRPPSKHTN